MDERVEVRLLVDVAGFMNAVRQAYRLSGQIYVAAQTAPARRKARLRRMHSAYSRKRGRGRW
jgi:hypothetical protein